jgi:hypothetical protein
VLAPVLAIISALHSPKSGYSYYPIIDFPSIVRVQSEATLLSLAGSEKPNFRVVQVETGRIYLTGTGIASGHQPRYKLIVSTVPFDSVYGNALGTFDPIPVLADGTVAPAGMNSRTFVVEVNPKKPIALSYGFFAGIPASELLISATLLVDGKMTGSTTIKRVKVFPSAKPEDVNVKQVPTPKAGGYTPIVRTMTATSSQTGLTKSSRAITRKISAQVSISRPLASGETMTTDFKLVPNGPPYQVKNYTWQTVAGAPWGTFLPSVTISEGPGSYMVTGTITIRKSNGVVVEKPTPFSTPLVIN